MSSSLSTDSAGVETPPRSLSKKEKEDVSYASQGRLVWRKFKKHKVAMVSLVVLAIMYLTALFADFVAPYPLNYRIPGAEYSSPTAIHVFLPGKGVRLPFVYAMSKQLDEKTFTYKTLPIKNKPITVKLFVRSEPYKLWGLVTLDRRLFGVSSGYVALFGTNKLGMDIYSQAVYGSRISLSIGLVGVTLSFILGLILGGISGYIGGIPDLLIQRLIEFIMCLPQLPLWFALSAAIPNRWSGIQTYFAITVILSLVGWTSLARVVRGRLISMREEDYVMAARLAGSRNGAIIRRHLLPGFTSYLIVNITLSIPGMIIGETTLSFLGLGIQPPDVSWGSMLEEADNLTIIFTYPWYLIPTVFVVVAILAFNFVGDGFRDAADPYH